MPLIDPVCRPTFEPRIGRSVSIDHASELLGVSRRTVYNRISEGRLQTVRTPGGSQRVLLGSLETMGGRLPDVPRGKTGLHIVATTAIALVLLASVAWPAPGLHGTCIGAGRAGLFPGSANDNVIAPFSRCQLS